MRIAVNTRFLLKGQLEGIGWYTYEIVKRMVEAHPEDTFYFFFDRPYDPAFIFGENVVPMVLPPPARHPVLWWLWFEVAIPRALRKLKPDVFFSPDTYLSLRAKTPTVLTVHDIAYAHYPEQIPKLARQYYAHFIPKYVQQAKRVITVSNFVREDVLRHIPTDPAKIQAVHNACRAVFKPLSDTEVRQIRDQYTAGEPYFVYVGAMHPRKNVHRLIQAFDAFKQQSTAPHKLVLAGRFAWQSGPIRSAYEAAVYKDDIVLTGYLEQTQLPRVVGAASALVYLSVFEGFGLPLVEAMACDVPVLTSNVTSLPEVAGEAALLVDPHKVEEIRSAMQQLAEDAVLRERLIQAGRRRRQDFSWDRAAEAVYKVLREVAGV